MLNFLYEFFEALSRVLTNALRVLNLLIALNDLFSCDFICLLPLTDYFSFLHYSITLVLGIIDHMVLFNVIFKVIFPFVRLRAVLDETEISILFIITRTLVL